MTIKEQEDVSISRACRLMGVCRSGYNKWLTTPAGESDAGFGVLVREVALANPFYGYRRVTAELRNRGVKINPKRVRRLMRKEGIVLRRKRFKLQTTDSNHSLRVYPNLAKNLKVTGLNQLWVADITYVRLEKGFIYSGSDIGCMQQAMHWMGYKPMHRRRPGIGRIRQGIGGSQRRRFSRVDPSLGSGSSVCKQGIHKSVN